MDSYAPSRASANPSVESEGDFIKFREDFLRILNSTGIVVVFRHGQRYELQGMNIAGGKCRFEYEYDNANQIQMIGLNGAECDRFLAGAKDLIRFACAGREHWHNMYAKLTKAADLWVACVPYFKALFYKPGEKEQAIAACKKFVRFWVLNTQGSFTYYMHMLYHHSDWFFAGEPHESVAWWSTQSLEAGHSSRKNIFRKKTLHGKPLEYKLPSGVILKIDQCAGLFQVFLWHWRVKEYEVVAMKKERQEGGLKCLNVDDLNVLKWMSPSQLKDLEDPLTSSINEQTLLDMFDMSHFSAINLQGRGDLKVQGLKLSVSFVSLSAKQKIEANKGTVIAIKKVYGKACAANRLVSYENEREAKNQKSERIGRMAVEGLCEA